MKASLALAALLLTASALAQETPAERAERILDANPCAFFPGDSTAECAAFGRSEEEWADYFAALEAWADYDQELTPVPEALEAGLPGAGWQLRAGDRVQLRTGGPASCAAATRSGGVAMRLGADPWTAFGASPAAPLESTSPDWQSQVMLHLIGARRPECWGQGVVGTNHGTGCAGRLRDLCLAGALPAGFDCTMNQQERLWCSSSHSIYAEVIRRWCQLPHPVPCGAPPSPPQPPPVPPTPPNPPEPPVPPADDLLVSVLTYDATADAWAFAVTEGGRTTQHSASPGAVVEVGRGVGFTLPRPPAAPSCPACDSCCQAPPFTAVDFRFAGQCTAAAQWPVDARVDDWAGRVLWPGDGRERCVPVGPGTFCMVAPLCPAASEPPPPPPFEWETLLSAPGDWTTGDQTPPAPILERRAPNDQTFRALRVSYTVVPRWSRCLELPGPAPSPKCLGLYVTAGGDASRVYSYLMAGRSQVTLRHGFVPGWRRENKPVTAALARLIEGVEYRVAHLVEDGRSTITITGPGVSAEIVGREACARAVAGGELEPVPCLPAVFPAAPVVVRVGWRGDEVEEVGGTAGWVVRGLVVEVRR